MNIELLKDGCLLMLIGMGFVFIFILLMVWIMQINSKLIGYINEKFPEPQEDEKYTAKHKKDDNAAIALAIACAIHTRKQA